MDQTNTASFLHATTVHHTSDCGKKRKYHIPKKKDIVKHRVANKLPLTIEQQALWGKMKVTQRRKYGEAKQKFMKLVLQMRIQNDSLILEEGEIAE